jgi:excisionase family DNA binding protein
MTENHFFSAFTLSELENTISKVVTDILDKRGQQETAEPGELITRRETAEILRVSLPTLGHWTKSGLLKSYKIASRVRYNRNEVLQMFNNGDLKRYGRR